MAKQPAQRQEELENLTTVTNLVKNYIATIEKTKNELRKHKEMLEDTFSNNPQYKEASEEAKEASKIKADVKRQILEQEDLLELSTKVKDLNLTLKETRAALSEYLVEYARLSGSKQIEDDNGKILQIVYSAHLVKAETNFLK